MSTKKIAKNRYIIHHYEFPLDTVLSLHRQIVHDAFVVSKHKNNLDEILSILDSEVENKKSRMPERIPIVSTILRNAYKYCCLIDQHPNYASIKTILIPEIADSLKDIIDSY